MDSELASFIEMNAEEILSAGVTFARTIPGGEGLSDESLRDYLPEILEAVVIDLRTPQTRIEAISKSEGRTERAPGLPSTAAATHALHRAHCGYSVSGLVSEYRALRGSILRLWSDSRGDQPVSLSDINRFNDAIDEAVAESVSYYAEEVERWRDVFLGVLGHELRNPLNAIVMTSELIARLAANTPIATVAGRLLNSGEHMSKLLTKLLVFNRGRLGVGILVEKLAVDLVSEFRQEVEAIRAAMPDARIELHMPNAVWGLFDAARLREVFSNLVINAHKYGTPGTPIFVGVRNVKAATELTVSNTGDRIEPQVFDQMFDPLRRGTVSGQREEEQASLGLGLFIVRQIAEAHGGSVRGEWDQGQTIFTVHLPRGELGLGQT